MITMEMKVLEAIKSKPDGMRLREISVPGDRANGDFGYIKYVWTGKGR